MVRWLHISDLHFNDCDMSTELLREELIKFLKFHNIQCDYVFCTGDIRTANANPNDFTDEAVQFLKDLCTAVDVPMDRLFIVPGNHDINRDYPGRHEMIEEICFKRCGNYKPKFGLEDASVLMILKESQKEFIEFLSKIYPEKRLELYKNPLQPHFNVETPDFNILHVDSTLVYTKGQEVNDLIFETRTLKNAIDTLNMSKPTILLSHYPFSSLLQDEKKMIKELLYKNNIEIWLSGHEHDHIVHQEFYWHSFQAGELRKESNTNATVLLGEFDTRTNSGRVLAYTWFPEGWADYPILWHTSNSIKENEYKFHLRYNEHSTLGIKAKMQNEKFVDRIEINENLLAHIEKEGLDVFLDSIWNSDTPHLILLADGGMGKTTLLFNQCKKSKDLCLYIPLEWLVSINTTIQEYCSYVLFENDINLFKDFCSANYSQPSLILLLDGLNEVDGENERKYVLEIKGLSLLKGIQFVITSRSDFTKRFDMPEFKVEHLSPLQNSQVQSEFTKDEWKEIQTSSTFCKLLSNPMMLTMYKQMSPLMKKYQNEESLHWILPIKNSTDLLYDYYISQIAILFQREGINGEKILKVYQILFEILPAIAYNFETTYCFNKTRVDYRDLVRNLLTEYSVDENMLLPLQEKYRMYSISNITLGDITDFLINETHLLYGENEYVAFPHQIHRDFLSALWITKQTNIEKYWNQRKLSYPVMEHIRNLSGQYWSGLAKRVHEFGKNKLNAMYLVTNLIECFPYSDIGGCPDYSYLDLRGLAIPNTVVPNSQKISLYGAKLDEVSIGKSLSQVKLYQYLSFSEDYSYLAAYSNKQVYIFSLLSNENVFVYPLEGKILKLKFVDNYLFVSTNASFHTCIYVFVYKNEWLYKGKIECLAGKNFNMFNSSFKSLVLNENVLYFYYNHREIQVSLDNMKVIYNEREKQSQKEYVSGVDLSDLENMDKQKVDKDAGIVWKTIDKGFTAISKIDGSLMVMRDKKTCNLLVKGVVVFKDASISENGKVAVTLSYEITYKQRKIQLWNLDKNRRICDLYCPKSINTIHLSQDGSFILGETKKQTWVYEMSTKRVQWFDEHFISNQTNKISTYGTKVLRKDDDEILYLYDLKTNESIRIELVCKNVKLACFMQDGTLAFVENDSHTFHFKNSRNNEYSRIKNPDRSIIGIHGIPNEPFIAVATKDKKISVYHIGVCKRQRILESNNAISMMAFSSKDMVIACSNGQQSLMVFNYYEKVYEDRKRGWWQCKTCSTVIDSNILDVSFNVENQVLVAILSNGQILYFSEKECKYLSTLDIITNFSVDAYDFNGCICTDSVRTIIHHNGG